MDYWDELTLYFKYFSVLCIAHSEDILYNNSYKYMEFIDYLTLFWNVLCILVHLMLATL